MNGRMIASFVRISSKWVTKVRIFDQVHYSVHIKSILDRGTIKIQSNILDGVFWKSLARLFVCFWIHVCLLYHYIEIKRIWKWNIMSLLNYMPSTPYVLLRLTYRTRLCALGAFAPCVAYSRALPNAPCVPYLYIF